MGYPVIRMRRMRASEGLRRMVRETHVLPQDLIYPLFIVSGSGAEEPVVSMPGVTRYSPDRLPQVVRKIHNLGIAGVILFGIPEYKDHLGSSAFDDKGPVQQAIKTIKDTTPELVVITDVCMCEYTSHGHCGYLTDDGRIDNDRSLEMLAQEALSHVKAGCDMVAPSDMMDGRIGYIRKALDQAGFDHIPIMSYAAKYASAFYGPFREAAESAPQSGDRKSYQMDPPNVREALREVELDIAEGADLVMVKPAMAYMDVIRAVRERFDVPLAAYNVSGEYSMIKAAAERGWIDEERIVKEVLTGIKRAGADIIITYFALDFAGIL
ncbi:MAG: porphobilinogen synthase [Syntrophomonadaceae bacterium]|jgi:porphobilinogen synthase|nr:porphobilinogen synthase [Syntrophomonadaceae bacterium]